MGFQVEQVFIDVQRDDNDLTIPFPLGVEKTDSSGHERIDLFLTREKPKSEPPYGPALIRKGALEAYGDRRHLVWVHQRLGLLVDSLPEQGKIKIHLPEVIRQRPETIFHHLVLPSLLYPLALRSLRVLHAGAVLWRGDGILFAGPSGCGKSTLVLRLIKQGAVFAADDMVFLSCKGNKPPIIWGVRERPRAHKDTWTRFPEWRTGAADWDGKKPLLEKTPQLDGGFEPKRLFLLSGKGETERNTLAGLLSLTFNQDDAEQAMRCLKRLREETEIIKVSDPETAFRMAESG